MPFLSFWYLLVLNLHWPAMHWRTLPVSPREWSFWVPGTSHFSSINRNLLFFSITQSGAHRSPVVDPTLLSPTHTPAHNARNHNTKILPDVHHSVSPDPIQDNFNKDMAKISSQHSEELDNGNDFNENSKSPATALLFWMITHVHLSRYWWALTWQRWTWCSCCLTSE